MTFVFIINLIPPVLRLHDIFFFYNICSLFLFKKRLSNSYNFLIILYSKFFRVCSLITEEIQNIVFCSRVSKDFIAVSAVINFYTAQGNTLMPYKMHNNNKSTVDMNTCNRNVLNSSKMLNLKLYSDIGELCLNKITLNKPKSYVPKIHILLGLKLDV